VLAPCRRYSAENEFGAPSSTDERIAQNVGTALAGFVNLEWDVQRAFVKKGDRISPRCLAQAPADNGFADAAKRR
jgi:hypothetical protein